MSLDNQREKWPVKPGEFKLVTLASLFSLGSVALAIFLRTWGDTIFLSHFSVDQIPIFYIWSAFAFAPVTMGYTWLSHRLPPVRLNTITLLVFVGLCSLCAQVPTDPTKIFIILLFMSLVSPLVNAICWSVILERLDSLQSKRLIPIIGSAATVGAIIAGGVAAEIIEWGGLPGLITLITLTLLSMSALPQLLLRPIYRDRKITKDTDTRASNAPKQEVKQTKSTLSLLLDNPLLTVTIIATLMMAITTNLVDYLFKAEIQRQVTVNEIGPFLARFHAITNLLVFMLQLFVLSRLTQVLGLKWAYSLYPSSLLLIGSICLFPVTWFGFVILRGVDTLMKFTIYANTENLVLTPVPYLLRTQVKVMLKGVIYPLGGLIAGVLIWVTAALCGEDTQLKIKAILMITLTLSTLWVIFTRRAHIYYIQQLANNLNLDPKLHTRDVDSTKLKQLAQYLIDAKKIEKGDSNLAIVQFYIELSALLDIDNDQLTMLWENDHHQADLVEWTENFYRLKGLEEVSHLLEVRPTDH